MWGEFFAHATKAVDLLIGTNLYYWYKILEVPWKEKDVQNA